MRPGKGPGGIFFDASVYYTMYSIMRALYIYTRWWTRDGGKAARVTIPVGLPPWPRRRLTISQVVLIVAQTSFDRLVSRVGRGSQAKRLNRRARLSPRGGRDREPGRTVEDHRGERGVKLGYWSLGRLAPTVLVGRSYLPESVSI